MNSLAIETDQTFQFWVEMRGSVTIYKMKNHRGRHLTSAYALHTYTHMCANTNVHAHIHLNIHICVHKIYTYIHEKRKSHGREEEKKEQRKEEKKEGRVSKMCRFLHQKSL